jgi:pyrroline-5-carboxylate reductase
MRENQLRIGFIGGGNMAQAIIRGLLAAGHNPSCLMVADPSADQQRALRELSADIQVGNNNASLAEICDILVLAVKPQIIADVARELGAGERPPDQLVISVAAGITLKSLQDWLGNNPRIVRVMPNTPALIGAGMSGLYADQDLDSIARGWSNYVMEATGDAIWVSSEALIDAVTAVSGSGPAYFFLIMEIMQEVAVELGLESAQAELLATRTAAGAGLLALQSEETAATLRERVTSPGGTTAAAIQSLEASGLRDILRTAMTAARDRAVELGKEA